jgi:sugar phosphate isomerase/epimerase
MIFASTSSLDNHSDAVETVRRLAEAGFRNIELGADHSYPADEKKIIQIKKEFGLNYIVHVFFPPAKEKFILNMGSANNELLKKSIKIAKNAIEFCNKAEAKIYSIHSGTVNEIDRLGNPISKQIPEKECIEITKNSLAEIADYAKKYGIDIAVENHTLLPGVKLFVKPTEILGIIYELNLKNVGLLVDVGHLNITSKKIGFDKKEEIEKVKDRIIEFHISENDGKADMHCGLTSTEMIECVPKDVLRDKAATVELFSKSISDVKRSEEIISKFIS